MATGADLPLDLHPLSGISDYDRVPNAVGQMLGLYDPVLPEFPYDTLRIVEGARSPGGPGVDVAAAMIQHHEVQRLGERMTDFGGSRLAAALHLQHWIPHDVREIDAALPLAVATAYTIGGAAAVEGPRAAERAFSQLRFAGNHRVTPGEIGWALGPILQFEASDPTALYRAVERVLRGEEPPSWDGLARALHTVTGRDWERFLLTWVRSGVKPQVTVRSGYAGDILTLEATSDLPFGELTVPVHLGRGDEARIAPLQVVDGRGELRIQWPGGAPKIKVDAFDLLPVRHDFDRGGVTVASNQR